MHKFNLSDFVRRISEMCRVIDQLGVRRRSSNLGSEEQEQDEGKQSPSILHDHFEHRFEREGDEMEWVESWNFH